MASRFDGIDDKAGADIYLFDAPGKKTEGANGEPSATISEAIARVRFRKQSGTIVGGILFVEGFGFVEEDEFDELLSVVRAIPMASVDLKTPVALHPDGGSGD